MGDFEVIQTTKKKPSAVHQGFQYRKYRTNKEDVVTWVCIREKSSRCYGRMKTKGNEVLQATYHVCKSDAENHTRLKKSTSVSKKRVREKRDNTVSDQEVHCSFHRDRLVDIPSYSLVDIISNRNNESRNFQRSSPKPMSSAEVSLLDNVSPKNSGSNCLSDNDMDTSNEDRHLVDSSSGTAM